MDEGQIARWTIKEGESFEAGETLAEVDTDKATMEMTALTAGTLLKILKGEGETAALGEAIAITGSKGEDISGLLSKGSPAAQSQPSATTSVGEAAALATKVEEPVAASLQPYTSKTQSATAVASATNGRLIVSPIAARMAAENGLDLKTISGSGPNGRIIKRDIESALIGGTKQVTRTFVDSTQFGSSPYRDEPTSKIRQVIASRLVESIGPVPTFYLTTEVEMDNALELRKAINAGLGEDNKISVNDIIVKVTAMSLVKHPFVNSSYRDSSIRFYEHADIGVAVAVEDGLITPVVRSADLKGFIEISSEIKDLAAKARARRLQPAEYTGATFSLSNLGMFGIKEFTAIINPPEAGILAVGGATPSAVVRDGQIVIRNIMQVTMSCDHRVIDGATGAKFLQTFKRMLEQPAMMLA